MFKHIANRLTVWTLSVATVLFLALAFFNLVLTRQLVETMAGEQAQLAVDNTTDRLDQLLEGIGHTVRAARALVSDSAGSVAPK